MDLTVYLAGEIHSDWRKEIIQGAEREGLPALPGHRVDPD
ncbi:MAG: YtoQ family protein, partial [Longimicrobiales bacterium]